MLVFIYLCFGRPHSRYSYACACVYVAVKTSSYKHIHMFCFKYPDLNNDYPKKLNTLQADENKVL